METAAFDWSGSFRSRVTCRRAPKGVMFGGRRREALPRADGAATRACDVGSDSGPARTSVGLSRGFSVAFQPLVVDHFGSGMSAIVFTGCPFSSWLSASACEYTSDIG